jgi:nitrogen fixation protein FixH
VRDGVGVADVSDSTLTFDAAGPGVFRVEARLGERTWILSNPIYLR